MKKITILAGSIAASIITAQATTLVFTDANAQVATVDMGTLGSIAEPADGSVVSSLSYTVSGLTIDNDGVLNDTVTFTFSVMTDAGSDINWDTNGVGVREFDHNGATFSAGDSITFGPISVSGAASGGGAYTLNSAVYTEISNRRWGTTNDESSIAGDVTTIASNTAATIGLNDTTFTQTGVAGTHNVQFVDFTVDVTAPDVTVPEPSSTVLFGLAGLALLARRGRK